MNALIPYLWVAGGVHVILVIGSFFLPSKLRYHENLSKVSPIIRQIFSVHHLFIALLLVGFSGLCFGFTADLAGGSHLGRCLSGFMAIFWLLRLLIQLFYYDQTERRRYPLANLVYLGIFLFLSTVFFVASMGILR